MKMKVLKRMIEKYPYLEDKSKLNSLPHVGYFYGTKNFSSRVHRVKEFYEVKSDCTYYTKMYSLTSGDPMNFPAFPPALNSIMKVLKGNEMYQYPQTTGNEKFKEKVLDYFIKIGIKNISTKNIAFINSTTHALNTIVELISKPGDVIITTAPSYGLFSLIPERLGVRVEFLDLKAENNWLINTNELKELITSVNKGLSKNNRIVAFLNQNPNNPLGKVMGVKEKNILSKIEDICLENDMYLIDDLVYRDLTFDRKNIALPIATTSNMSDNIISLFGISKSYGLAGIRGGVILANDYIIKLVQDKIFQTMDSISILTSAAIAGTYNGNNQREIEYNNYFSKVIDEYKYKYQLFKSLIKGIDIIGDQKNRKRIYHDIKKNCKSKKKFEKIIKGSAMISLVDNLEVESGFFALLDLTKIKGKKYKDYVINNEIDLFKYIYTEGRTKVICGQGMVWPKQEELIIRVTFAIDNDLLIKTIISIIDAIDKLN